jgi:hypothetical protein
LCTWRSGTQKRRRRWQRQCASASERGLEGRHEGQAVLGFMACQACIRHEAGQPA